MDLTHEQRIDLRKRMIARFTTDDIRTLCNALGIEYENLGGDTRDRKVLELIGYCQRRSMLGRLVAACVAEAPDVAWPGRETIGAVVPPEPSLTITRPGRSGTITTILFMSANPAGTLQLRIENEKRTVDEQLQLTAHRDRFNLEFASAMRVSDITRNLLRYEPAIVHFSGHGMLSGLVFEDDAGNAQQVSPEALGRLFGLFDGKIRCVVLNACWSAIQADAIAKSVGCVIGMSERIGDSAAIKFAAGFYQALGYGRDCQRAFAFGCAEIDLSSLPEAHKPQIITRAGVNASDIRFVNA
jgi:hypothetical protein